MGWTWYQATQYKKGKVDRKAECDDYFMKSNSKYYVVEKSSMVGNVYYAAIRAIGTYNYKEKTVMAIPKEYQYVFAVVFLTSTNAKDVYNFGYKDMDETCGPCEADCPKSILELLTPTDSEWANQWRQRCYDNLERKKNSKWLTKLPFGSKVRFTFEDKAYILEKSAPGGQFKNWYWYVEEHGKYMPKNNNK